MRLIDLLDGETIEVTGRATWNDTAICGLTCDSRKVAPGFLFAALPGTNDDGIRHMEDALARGAAAVLAPPPINDDPGVPVVLDDNPRRRYALMAARFYGKQPSTIAAVTGTNGKTSVVSFARQIWTSLGEKAGSLGTLGLTAPGFEAEGGLTTPDAADLHNSLAELADAGVHKLAMEASSHGLTQYRLDGVRVSVAAFTNLSRDHLDYHASMGDYLEAKQRLFADILAEDGVAVLNADDETFPALQEIAQKRRLKIISYGCNGAKVRLNGLQPTTDGQRLKVTISGQRFSVDLPLAGNFQAANALCALSMVIADGADVAAAAHALESLEGVAGRMQRIARLANEADIYLDYAHTPDALQNILHALRPHTAGSLKVVFGCGGDRDAGKRPEMGRIAAEMADHIYVTDDNPRGEDAAAIRSQILDACPEAEEIADRAEAITVAVASLEDGDVLVVAGKGHETGQIIGDTSHPFSDEAEIRRAVSEAGQ